VTEPTVPGTCPAPKRDECVPIRARRRRAGTEGATVGDVPRPLRTTFPDGLYHITGHATGSEDLFRSDLDHEEFRQLVARVADRHDWSIHARCSMGNHFHMLIDTTRAHMSAGMHALLHTYTKRFNKRYRRRGCLFEGRYSSTWIKDEEHYSTAMEYIRQNPVKDGFCERADELALDGDQRPTETRSCPSERCRRRACALRASPRR